MKLSQILEKIENKIKECKEYQSNIDFFNDNAKESTDLSLLFLQDLCKTSDVYDFKILDKFLFDASYIKQFIIRLKFDLEEKEVFNYDFFNHLKDHKPKSFQAFLDWIRRDISQFHKDLTFPDDDPPEILQKKVVRIIGLYTNSLRPMDVFDTLVHDDTDSLKIKHFLEMLYNKESELLAYKQRIEHLSPSPQERITNKVNLIRLLDFCNELILKNEGNSFDIILKKFEEEKTFYGSLSTWDDFFKTNFLTIKELTNTQFEKTRYGLFALNDNRDKIDQLFEAIKIRKMI